MPSVERALGVARGSAGQHICSANCIKPQLGLAASIIAAAAFTEPQVWLEESSLSGLAIGTVSQKAHVVIILMDEMPAVIKPGNDILILMPAVVKPGTFSEGNDILILIPAVVKLESAVSAPVGNAVATAGDLVGADVANDIISSIGLGTVSSPLNWRTRVFAAWICSWV